MGVTWHAVQTTAKANGDLIYAVSQSRSDPLTMPGPWGNVTAGYCLGLAVRWVSLCYAGQDFPHAGHEISGYDWQATRDQNLAWDLYSSGGAGDFTAYWKTLLENYGMLLSGGLRAKRDTKPSGALLRTVAAKAYGCYAVDLGREGGGHSIAMRHGRDGRFHLFDANYGHFARRGPDVFQAFLDWCLDKTGYADRYQKATWVRGVKPPMYKGTRDGI